MKHHIVSETIFLQVEDELAKQMEKTLLEDYGMEDKDGITSVWDKVQSEVRNMSVSLSENN